jgi:hypothetical protein
MSTLKKNSLALAILAAAGFAANAGAYSVAINSPAGPTLVSTADIVDATTDIGVISNTGTAAQGLVISLDSNDLILGRTQGLAIRLTLSNGATWANQLVPGDFTVGAAGFGGTANTWTVSVAAGGAPADNFVVIVLNPPVGVTPVPGLTTGELVVLEEASAVTAPAAAGFALDSLTALQTAGQQVTVTSFAFDPITTNQVLAPLTTAVLQSGNPLQLACDDAGRSDINERIDVGTTGLQGSKTYFSSTGAIGLADNGVFNAGTVDVSVAAGFAFTYAAGDVFRTTLTGNFASFAPFAPAAGSPLVIANGANVTRGLFLAATNACATSIGTATYVDANTIQFDYTFAQAGFAGTGGSLFLCAEIPGGNTTVIAPTTFSATTRFTRGAFNFTGAACTDLAPLQNNGSVVNVFNLSPAGSPSQDGLIRVVNNGNTGGTVRITGRDDAGVAGAAAVTFTLPAGQAVTYTSAELESGVAATVTPAKPALSGGLGNGAGRWFVNVTGEFDKMGVQAYARNLTDGTLSNITDVDNNEEQRLESKNN